MLSELPPELILHIVSFLTREIMLNPGRRLLEYPFEGLKKLVPDLPSINALSQTNIAFHGTLDQTLYELCTSVKSLGELAFLFAVEHELESTVDKLVTAGLSLNTEIRFRGRWCSLLHVAAGAGLRDMIVKLLKMYGEEMTVMMRTRNRGGSTALDWAACDGHLEIVRLLAPIHNHATPPLTEFETREYLSHPLIESAVTGNLELSKYLLAEGADVNFHSARDGRPPLYHAAAHNHLDMVQFLIASGADPNNYGKLCIPLFAACNTDVAQVLLDAGANLHAEDRDGYNILGAAVTGADLEMARFFLERGVDPNHEDFDGETPLHWACMRRADARVELLVQFGATTVEHPDRQGRTPVGIAMDHRDTEIVKMLEPLVQDADLKRKITTWWGSGREP
ncbi:ankyrin repeat-containing domain protein [Mycena galopus ATCC 62051]|nr:ankyrin repeat-containing domain protein [Mycena galopus ATCC 62051]